MHRCGVLSELVHDNSKKKKPQQTGQKSKSRQDERSLSSKSNEWHKYIHSAASLTSFFFLFRELGNRVGGRRKDCQVLKGLETYWRHVLVNCQWNPTEHLRCFEDGLSSRHLLLPGLLETSIISGKLPKLWSWSGTVGRCCSTTLPNIGDLQLTLLNLEIHLAIARACWVSKAAIASKAVDEDESSGDPPPWSDLSAWKVLHTPHFYRVVSAFFRLSPSTGKIRIS